jgi:hypothetical protein
MEAWRHLQTVEKYSPGRVPPQLMNQVEAEYNQVKPYFSNTQGNVRKRWTDKSIKQMADDVGLLNIYEVAYGTAWELHHMPVSGVIGHELNWVKEALFVAYGALLGTVVSLCRVAHVPEAEFRSRLSAAIANFGC